MMRTAMAARPLPWMMLTLAVLCSLAWVPNQALAQEPEGAGAAQAPATQSTASQQAQAQAAPSKPAHAQAQASKPAKPSKAKAKPKTSLSAAPSHADERLAAFAWLAGRWQGNWGPRTAQEIWLPPQSGVMVGVFQLTDDYKTLVIELYTIMATPQGVELRVRHFTPSLTPWQKSEPSVLNLMTYDSKSFLFVNKYNGEPKHWLMRRTASNTYVARFEIVPENNQVESSEIVFHRQSIPATLAH
ncbi:MAG TPA: DUF6265 family protein [Candidatus Dormibacteraeota bacterium]|nr:DUF6265 family protein [Candidatus Dormibacteraeota bacterium]